MATPRLFPRFIVICLAAGALSLISRGTLLTAAEEPVPSVVVLTDGRVYTGLVVEVGGGYRVDAAGQFVVLPFDHVRVTAPTVHSAYEKLRDAVRQPTVDDHLRLAEWCLSNNLPGEAHTEVVRALQLDPLRSDARQMFQRIEQKTGPAKLPTSGAGGPQAALPMQAFSATESISRSGLSRSAMEEYVRRVQPLLMNKCGNAGCHGQGSSQAFRLTNTRLGAGNHKLATESNLETLAKYLDIQNPSASPLLRKPVEPTPQHQTLFAAENRELLRVVEAFVELVARERRGSGSGIVQQAPRPVNPPQLITPPQNVPNPQNAVQPVSAQSPPVSRGAPDQNPDTQAFLQNLRQEMLPDAFDPDDFNRRVHGRTAAELRGGAAKK